MLPWGRPRKHLTEKLPKQGAVEGVEQNSGVCTLDTRTVIFAASVHANHSGRLMARKPARICGPLISLVDDTDISGRYLETATRMSLDSSVHVKISTLYSAYVRDDGPKSIVWFEEPADGKMMMIDDLNWYTILLPPQRLQHYPRQISARSALCLVFNSELIVHNPFLIPFQFCEAIARTGRYPSERRRYGTSLHFSHL